MAAIAREQSSNCSNPILDIYTQTNGQILDVYRLEYQIFDISTPERDIAPVQVYPTTPGERALVNPNLCGAGGGKLSTGHYVADWTPGADHPIGTHAIRWYMKLTPSSPEQAFAEEFEVLPSVSGYSGDGYCTVADLRNEGVTQQEASDFRLQELIETVSEAIDKYTGFFFRPRTMTVRVDSYGSRILQLDQPIIAVSEVLENGAFVDPEHYLVYNRHISQKLRRPDDRFNPKLERIAPNAFYSPRWREGRQNITISGVFGFTEPDGSPHGAVPRLIRHAAKLMVMREIPLMSDIEGRQDALQRWRLAEEKTRDQSYRLSAQKPRSGDLIFTGDNEIDNILAAFQHPLGLGAA